MAPPDPDLSRIPRPSDVERPHPIYCVWELTLACDLGCRHCGSRAGRARPQELSTASCLDVVRELHEIGVREVTLIGGEAYLREDWDVIAAEITRRGMSCSITTGARNLDADRVRRAVEAGIGAISISIDGLEQTHDALRGVQGSWRAAMDAAERVAATPIQLGFNSQINRLSLPELPGIADALVEVGGAGWQIQLTVPMGRAADRPELLLQPYDLLELFPLLVWIKRERLQPAGIALFLGNNIGYFSPFEEELRYGGEQGASWSACSAGRYTLGLEADGKIKGCPSLPTRSFTGGVLGRDRLADVVENAPELRSLRERTVEDLWGLCRTCPHAARCLGGCSWMTTMLLGRPGNNPYCISRALALEAHGKQERVVRVERAPGEPFDGGRFEIVLEEAPAASAPTLLGGRDPAQVLAVRAHDQSLWSAEALRERLRRT
ncbi:MAG: radical SAM protein [Deltaproteobacteria bacterium]|nr:MAG: radical SAM protein [Deltaproteobacteria bacterium]